ncbi:MAG: DUF4349 domain-containing protein [Bacteroidota bacterium]|nr:DUF4349 domain-containing protein [Bacteroidota bacterium]
MSNSINCSNANQVRVRRENSLLKKYHFIYLSTIASALLFQSCGGGRYEKEAYATSEYEAKQKAVADSVSAYSGGIKTDTINGITHNFVRNANIKFKVKDVFNTTKQIEDIVAQNGGYVVLSDLKSNSNYMNTIQFKKDSVLELNYFTTISNISIRVPNKQLDSVVRKITEMAIFIDFRILKADDVKMKLYANKLAENRYNQYKKNVKKSVETTKAKLNQVNEAHETILEKQTLADQTSIESMDLIDHVNYSTLNLELYQAQSVTSEAKPLSTTIKPYEASFLSKLGHSFLNGFQLLKNLVLFFVDIWGILFILVILFFSIKKIVHYFTKKSVSV